MMEINTEMHNEAELAYKNGVEAGKAEILKEIGRFRMTSLIECYLIGRPL